LFSLLDQATSPINIETKQVESMKIETGIKGILPHTKNKCIQTSKPL